MKILKSVGKMRMSLFISCLMTLGGVYYSGQTCLAAPLATMNLPDLASTLATAQSRLVLPSAVNSASLPPTVPVPVAEFYTLQKIAVLKDSQREVIESLQAKFWFVLVMGALVAFFGIRSLVRELVASELKDAMRAAADAQSAAALAKDTVKELRADAAKYLEYVAAATQTAATLNAKLDELRTRIEAEGERSVAAAEIKIEGVQSQIDALKSMIDGIAGGQIHQGESPEKTTETIRRVKQKTLDKEKEFLSRAGIQIAIASSTKASDVGHILASRLSKLGYRVRRSVWSGGHAEPGTVEISHTPNATLQAQGIVNLLANEFGPDLRLVSVRSVEKPVSNTDDEIILLVA